MARQQTVTTPRRQTDVTEGDRANTVGMDTSTSEGCVADKTVIYVPSQDDPNQDGIQQTA